MPSLGGFDLVIAAILSALAVAGGIAVFVVDSMARATWALAVSFVAVGGLLIVIELPYLGVVTVLMMVMEMAVMGVFMVMFMMNPAGLMPMSMVHNKRGSLVLSVGAFVVLAAGSLLIDWPQRAGPLPADTTQQLGRSIMGSKMLVMMTTSAVMLSTLVGAVVLASARNRYDARPAHLVRVPRPGLPERPERVAA